MSKTYRIAKCEGYGRIEYLVQRRSIFGFWYNPDNQDAYTTGYYDTLQDARAAIGRKTTKVKRTIINT